MSDFEEAIERAAIAFLWALVPSADEKASSEASRAMIAAVGIRAHRTGGVFTADNVDATAAEIAALAREKFRSWIMRPGGPLPESAHSGAVSTFDRMLDEALEARVVALVEGRR